MHLKFFMLKWLLW